MSDDKPLDDAVLEAAAQIDTATCLHSDPEELRLSRHVMCRANYRIVAERIIATAAAQPAVRERVAKAQEEETKRRDAALRHFFDMMDRQIAASEAYAKDAKSPYDALPTVWQAMNMHFRDLTNELRAALAQEGHDDRKVP